MHIKQLSYPHGVIVDDGKTDGNGVDGKLAKAVLVFADVLRENVAVSVETEEKSHNSE